MLAEVPDWRGLADWLNIPTGGIHENCAREVDLAMCYRRELVRRYCDKQSSGNPYEIAEGISMALEKMNKNRQAEKLRNLVLISAELRHGSGWLNTLAQRGRGGRPSMPQSDIKS